MSAKENNQEDSPNVKEIVMCVECEDVPAGVRCIDCSDALCGLCYQWLHRKGKRALHKFENVHGKDQPAKINVEGTTEHFVRNFVPENKPQPKREKEQKLATEVNETAQHFLHQIKCIPLRLTEEERNLLSLLEAALNISEYTDKVDVSRSMSGYGFGFWSFSSFGRSNERENKTEIIQRELGEVFSLISGLFTATNFRQGKKLVANDFAQNEDFFQTVFEVGRRFKIMNPDRMRDTYGKLMHLLQDAVNPSNCDFEVIKPIQTVYRLLKENECIPLVEKYYKEFIIASDVIPDDCLDVHFANDEKNRAKEFLQKIFVADSKILTEEQLELCISSVNDYHSYIKSNCYPVEVMLGHLKHYFDANAAETKAKSLEIRSGMGGSCLSHSHTTQYKFVMQSLMLWRDIQRHMCELWLLTDEDLLDPHNRYRLCNTGQGLNRVQAAPRISVKMREILGSLQAQLGSWIGLSVVHLGDRDVPNALVFIDKYTQVPRILGPIVRALERLEDLVNSDDRIRDLIDSRYDGLEHSKLVILRDYFRHGFDGSGDDGGSCIDGRLTSSWNWTSKLEKKYFYNLFKLGDFDGFDGEFRSN